METTTRDRLKVTSVEFVGGPKDGGRGLRLGDKRIVLDFTQVWFNGQMGFRQVVYRVRRDDPRKADFKGWRML